MRREHEQICIHCGTKRRGKWAYGNRNKSSGVNYFCSDECKKKFNNRKRRAIYQLNKDTPAFQYKQSYYTTRSWWKRKDVKALRIKYVKLLGQAHAIEKLLREKEGWDDEKDKAEI